MLAGPMVDVELVDQDKVPDGVNISIAHFLNTAECGDIRQETERDEHLHHILKIEMNDEIDVQNIENISSLQSSYLSTEKFQGKNLCIITTATDTGEEVVQCSHSSIQRFAVTK